MTLSSRFGRTFGICALLLALPLTPFADNTDVYHSALRTHYLHVLMDLGDVGAEQTLCTFGVDCQVPFMSKVAHSQLSRRFRPGDKVSASEVFRAVLVAALSHPALSDVSIALAISNHHSNGLMGANPGRGGGTILQGYRRPAQARRSTRNLMLEIPRLSGARAHAFQPRESFLEWLRYIRGEPVALGENTVGNYGMALPIPDVDNSIIQQGVYKKGIAATALCPLVQTLIYVANSTGFDAALDADLDNEIALEVGTGAGGSLLNLLQTLSSPSFNLLPGRTPSVRLSEVWVVGSQQGAGSAQELADTLGTPAMFVADPSAFEQMLTSRLLEWIVPPPVSTKLVFGPRIETAQGTRRDVFLAQAEIASGVAWRGNLKKLRWNTQANSQPYSDSYSVAQITDALGNPALLNKPGGPSNLRFDALSFWTEVATLRAGDGVHIPEGVDGSIVARGGAGQKIDGFLPDPRPLTVNSTQLIIGDFNEGTGGAEVASRQVFVESPEDAGLLAFDATAATVARLNPWLNPDGDLTGQEVIDLIRWGRGQDTNVSNGVPRDWLLGELLHSTPAVLNYGAVAGHSDDNPKVRLFFGSGDGLFRSVENTTVEGAESGREVFAFYPLESLPNLRHIQANRLSAAQKVYGVDGPPQLLVRDLNGDGNLVAAHGDKAVVVFGMGRGGASYYALDVSDPEVSPSLLWKISGQASNDFRGLALTLSPPVVIKVDVGGNIVDAVVFGGGYNGGWTPDFTGRVGKDAGSENDERGNVVYIVEALTGKLIWRAEHGQTGQKSSSHYEHAGLVDGIAAPVVPLLDGRGVATRLYVGDTGGAVWRIDLRGSKAEAERSAPASWFITKFADLGADAGEDGGSLEDDRRFFYAVDVVRAVDAAGPFDGVLIASGNRASPNRRGVQNYLFYLKDRHVQSGAAALREENDVARPRGRLLFDDVPVAGACADDAESSDRSFDKSFDRCRTVASVTGWKLPLPENGEKGLAPPLVDAGRVFFPSYVPGSRSQCAADIGRGKLYEVSLAEGLPEPTKPAYFDLGPGIPEPVQAIDSVLFIPGWPTDRSESESSDGSMPSRFAPSKASRLVDLYWIEHGIDLQ